MKIPVGDFGYNAGQLGGKADIPAGAAVQQGGAELASAGVKLGREMAADGALDQRIEYGEAHRQRLEAEQVAREAKRAQAMTVHAQAQNALASAHDQITQGIQTGSISVDAAPKLWAEQSAKIVDQHLKSVDRANVDLVQAGLEGNVGSFGRSINQAITARNRGDIGAKLVDYLEEMQRFGITDAAAAKKQGTMAIDAQAPLAGYNPEQVAKMRHAFTEQVTFNAANAQLVNIKDDRKALEQFVGSLAGMGDLDPNKRNILTNQANSAIAHLDNKALAAENRRLVMLQRTGLQLETRIAMGIPVDAGDLERYIGAAKGTQFEESARGLLDEQRAVTDILRKPPAEQAAAVGAMEQHLVTTGEGNVKIINRLKQTVGNTIKLINDNPLQYAMDRGGAIVDPLDMTKPDTWNENLAHRAQVLVAQQKQVGGGLGALFPQEAATMARVMQDSTPGQKVAFLEPMRRAIGDDRVFRATVQQFAKDSPVTALAAIVSTKENPQVVSGIFSRESYQPGDVAMKLLKGEHILNPTKGDKAQDGKGGGFPMPKDADAVAMQQRFADAVGEVFADAPDAYRVQVQAARAYYAATLAERGDFSGQLDSRAWGEAIRATLPVVRFNGKPVAAPWGMDEGAFKDRVANALPQALKAVGLPPEMAQASGRYTLQNLTGNTYLVRQGTDYLTGPKGRVMLTVPEPASWMRDAGGRVAIKQVPD